MVQDDGGENTFLRERSGTIQSDSKLVSFLYELMLDHLPPGKVEEIVRSSQEPDTTTYTNGWLALYAKDLSDRLEGSGK